MTEWNRRGGSPRAWNKNSSVFVPQTYITAIHLLKFANNCARSNSLMKNCAKYITYYVLGNSKGLAKNLGPERNASYEPAQTKCQFQQKVMNLKSVNRLGKSGCRLRGDNATRHIMFTQHIFVKERRMLPSVFRIRIRKDSL